MNQQQLVAALKNMARSYAESGSSGGHWLYEDVVKLIKKLERTPITVERRNEDSRPQPR